MLWILVWQFGWETKAWLTRGVDFDFFVTLEEMIGLTKIGFDRQMRGSYGRGSIEACVF